jgi:hypothetical protein
MYLLDVVDFIPYGQEIIKYSQELFEATALPEIHLMGLLDLKVNHLHCKELVASGQVSLLVLLMALLRLSPVDAAKFLMSEMYYFHDSFYILSGLYWFSLACLLFPLWPNSAPPSSSFYCDIIFSSIIMYETARSKLSFIHTFVSLLSCSKLWDSLVWSNDYVLKYFLHILLDCVYLFILVIGKDLAVFYLYSLLFGVDYLSIFQPIFGNRLQSSFY